jgi:low temperature requirement protein LtrA
MAGRKLRTISNIIFLSLFLSITLFINFFHTENTIQPNHNCPACQFQNSTLATNQINFFHLPQLVLLETLKTFEIFHYSNLCFINPTSRSPPNF